MRHHNSMQMCKKLVAEVLLVLFVDRVLPLWVGARGVEFDWRYIQISLDSNISLVISSQFTFCLVTLVT